MNNVSDLFFSDADSGALRTLSRLNDSDLRARMGASACLKAEGAVQRGDVHDMEWLNPTLLSGRVRLAGIAPRAQIRFQDDQFTSQCACLLAGECEHVAALILNAQAMLNTSSAYSQGWDDILDTVLGDVEASGDPLALYLEYSAGVGEIWLTPMRPGVKRPWVTKRAGWNDIISVEWGSVTDGLNPTHLGILREIYRISREQQQSNNQGEVTLSSLRNRAFSLLRRAQDHGIALIHDLVTWEEVNLIRAQRQVLIDERIDVDGIYIHPLLGQTDAADEPIPQAETTIAQIEIREGGRHLREVADQPVEDHLLKAGIIHIPTQDIARYLAEYAPRLRARYPHAPADAPPSHEGKEKSEGSGAYTRRAVTHEENDSVLLGRLEPRREGRNIRLTWWARYTHHDQVSEARLSGRKNSRQVSHINPVLLQRWEELNQQVQAQILTDAESFALEVLWPHTHDAWSIHHWDFPAYLLALFEERIIGATSVRGIEWDLTQLDGAIHINDAPMQIHAHIHQNNTGQHSHTSASGAVDWFDLSASITVGTVEIPLSEALRAIAAGEERLFIQGQWVRLDGERIRALHDALEQAGALSAEQRRPQLSTWQAHIWTDVEQIADDTKADTQWLTRIAHLPASGNLEPLPLVESHSARLRPYQMEGHHWLTSLMRAGLGGVLADDMGLGKTLQMLAAIASLKNSQARHGHPSNPIVVVAPTSVASTWVNEAQRWYPHMRVTAVKTTSKVRSHSLHELAKHSDVIVTTYAVARLDAEEFTSLEWEGCVLDEAHIAKNPRTAIYRVLRHLPRNWTIALTGTPVENSLSDLWALLSLTSPGLLPNWQRFRERFVTPIDKYESPAILSALRRSIAPFMLRRTKEAVATDLPGKSETLLSVPMSHAARQHYERLLTAERARILGLLASGGNRHVEVLSAITRLRQVAIDPALVDQSFSGMRAAKTDALVEVLEQILPSGHQALVFSQFTAYLDRIALALDEVGITYVRLDGTTRDRDRVIARFHNRQAPVFLISLKAGGTGLTLTEADYVFVMDPWWNPAAEAQAIDRAHRIGQTKPVTVYRLVSEDTIEEKVIELQEKKRALADMLVLENTGSGGRINADDIRALLD